MGPSEPGSGGRLFRSRTASGCSCLGVSACVDAPPDADRPRWGSPSWAGTPSEGCRRAGWPETSSPPWGSASELHGTPAGQSQLWEKTKRCMFTLWYQNLNLKFVFNKSDFHWVDINMVSLSQSPTNSVTDMNQPCAGPSYIIVDPLTSSWPSR